VVENVEMMLFNFLVLLALFYFLFCFVLYFSQDRLIFKPTKIPVDYTFPQFPNAQQVFLPIDEGQVHALHFKTKQPKGLILYFHGNSQALESWGYAAEDFTKLGFEVFMPDYRSYGKSDGTISEAKLYQDAFQAFDYVHKIWPASKLVLYGRSLGTGIATELATKLSPNQLILETPYTSMPAMANRTVPFVPVKYLMKYQFRSIQKINRLLCPAHIIAAGKDMLTPHAHAVALANKLGQPEKVLTTINEAGHNNINEFPLYHQTIKTLLSNIK